MQEFFKSSYFCTLLRFLLIRVTVAFYANQNKDMNYVKLTTGWDQQILSKLPWDW